MKLHTINSHPILDIPDKKLVSFSFNGKEMKGYENMMLSSALFMNGIKIFGHHEKDNSAQGIFCANGQCAQCTVIVNGKALKSCMTALKENMIVKSCEGNPKLPSCDGNPKIKVNDVRILNKDILVIGAGPSGLSASKLLGEKGVNVLLLDDKDRTGGKLVLQTHKFFGSQKDVYAGKRGIEIGDILGKDVKNIPNVEIWLNSTVVAVFSDGYVGITKNNSEYILIKPKRLLIATGAREKSLIFPGNTLPGVYGAGAFQTLVNRDLVKPSDKIFIVGGGNVGLIAGYHAIQANIEVIGLIEALPKCGGYYVHETKLRRLGVPIYTRHTIISANSNGDNSVKSITIGKLDDGWNLIKGSERTFECDTILIAVGLTPVDEFYHKAKKYNIPVWIAGDAQEIAEASAAIFTGRIEAIKILEDIGIKTDGDLQNLEKKAAIMKAHPPKPIERDKETKNSGVIPILHCNQKIPCNPCTTVCPNHLIGTFNDEISEFPYYEEKDDKKCIGCGRCVAVCPGLAITLVDYRKDSEYPKVTFAYEIATEKLEKSQEVIVVNDTTNLGKYKIVRARFLKEFPKTQLITVLMPKNIAKSAIGIRSFPESSNEPLNIYHKKHLTDEAIICRCERVTAGEIRKWIKKGVTDINQLKAITRAGMGACGSKTCESLINRLMKEEGIQLDEVTPEVKRPLFVEVPLGILAGAEKKEDN